MFLWTFVKIFLCGHVFNALWQIISTEIFDNSMFNIFKNFEVVFHSGWIIILLSMYQGSNFSAWLQFLFSGI